VADERTDEAILRDAASGNRESFRELVERYTRRVFSVSYRYLGNVHDAQDATQEAFTRAFASAGRFEPRGSVYAWLMRITVNTCINELRARRHRPLDRDDEGDLGGKGGEDDLLDLELRRQVRKALDELPPAQRMAVILAKYEGFSYDEIAGIMDRSVASVESLIVRGKRALAEKLAPYIVSH